MPYTIKWEERGVVWTYSGIVSGEELLESNQRIYGDSRFDEIAYQIVDLTSVEGIDVTGDEMLIVAANDRAAALTNPRVRIAVVARDQAAVELSTLYESAIADSPWEQQIFAEMEEARSWAIPHSELIPPIASETPSPTL